MTISRSNVAGVYGPRFRCGSLVVVVPSGTVTISDDLLLTVAGGRWRRGGDELHPPAGRSIKAPSR